MAGKKKDILFLFIIIFFFLQFFFFFGIYFFNNNNNDLHSLPSPRTQAVYTFAGRKTRPYGGTYPPPPFQLPKTADDFQLFSRQQHISGTAVSLGQLWRIVVVGAASVVVVVEGDGDSSGSCGRK